MSVLARHVRGLQISECRPVYCYFGIHILLPCSFYWIYKSYKHQTMTPAIIHYILLHIGIQADAYIDERLIKKNKDVHTFWQYFWRVFGFIGLSALFAYWYDNTYAWESLVCSPLVYWWTFDVSLNIRRFRSFRFDNLIYLSDDGIDKIQTPWEIWFFIKMILFILASMYWLKPSLFQVWW